MTIEEIKYKIEQAYRRLYLLKNVKSRTALYETEMLENDVRLLTEMLNNWKPKETL
jgi:hypothetical protein